MQNEDAYEEWTYRGQKRCFIGKDGQGHWHAFTQTPLRWPNPTDLYDHDGHERVWVLDAPTEIVEPDKHGWTGLRFWHSRDLCLDENGEPWGSMGPDNINLRREGSIKACRGADDVRVWEVEDVKLEIEKYADQLIALENFIGRAENG